MAEVKPSTDAELSEPQIALVKNSNTQGGSEVGALGGPAAEGAEPLASHVEFSEDAVNNKLPTATDFEVEGQLVLILCGLIASGKVNLVSEG